MDSQQLFELSTFARQLAANAAKVIVDESQSFSQSLKKGIEPVTSADLKADELIRTEIEKRYPTHRILSEESSPDLTRWSEGPLWVIDPIDGTVNYSYGQPSSCVSIGFVLDGVAQFGVVHNPFLNEVYTALRGQGAHLNGKPIHVREQTELRRTLVATGFPYDRTQDIDPLMKRLRAVLLNCRDIRRGGSAAMDMCWVAAGRLDAYYETVNPWDMAAAALIAAEAGARISHLSPPAEGIPLDLHSRDLILSTPGIHEQFAKLLCTAL